MAKLPKKNKTILITGGAGFIGSNFIPLFLAHNLNYNVVNLDNLTYAGSLNNINQLQNHSRYTFVRGDICNADLISELFIKYKISGVIHFAAESHVDNSISSPLAFIDTNIKGTFTLLEVARKHWKETENRFHHISTDEVFGSLGDTGYFTENSRYQPNSPYSASKASSDFLVRSYHHTYGMNVVTSNCSNNYGPKQHDEKLIPTIIRTAISSQEIPIYGNGKNIRDWLYVQDHCEGINTIFNKGKAGEIYLLGGNYEYDNLSIAKLICLKLDALRPKKKGSYKDQINFVKDRAGHDYRYAIDASKSNTELGWQSVEKFDTGLDKTICWYLNKYQKE